MDKYFMKYLKYKKKYLEFSNRLSHQKGGMSGEDEIMQMEPVDLPDFQPSLPNYVEKNIMQKREPSGPSKDEIMEMNDIMDVGLDSVTVANYSANKGDKMAQFLRNIMVKVPKVGLAHYKRFIVEIGCKYVNLYVSMYKNGFGLSYRIFDTSYYCFTSDKADMMTQSTFILAYAIMIDTIMKDEIWIREYTVPVDHGPIDDSDSEYFPDPIIQPSDLLTRPDLNEKIIKYFKNDLPDNEMDRLGNDVYRKAIEIFNNAVPEVHRIRY